MFCPATVVASGIVETNAKGNTYLGRADVFAAYFAPTRSIYLVPVVEATSFAVRLRLLPTLNNQRRRVRLAADYEIERWTVEDLCALARSSPGAGVSDAFIA
jgi:hypothetical protein